MDPKPMDPKEEPAPTAENPTESKLETRPSKYWHNKIAKNLRAPQREHMCHGRLNPHSMYQNNEGLSSTITRFYSDHFIHPERLIDSQIFTRWAIDEALKDYPVESTFEVTGEIMKGERLTVAVGKAPVPKEVVEAIQAEGLKEVDMEDPNRKDTDCEIFQEIGKVAEEIIAASPNSLGPPVEACSSYLYMKKCGEYGRNKLTVWRSPLLPNLDGQDGRRGLLDNQLTGIVFIMSRFLGKLPRLTLRGKNQWDPLKKRYIQPPESQRQKSHREKLRGPQYFGCVLADSMGLGKTITTIACIDIMIGQALNVAREEGKPKYRPILILVPTSTVASQWVDEIEQVGSRHSIKKIIISGNGARKKIDQDRTRILTCKEFVENWPDALQYVWDENNKEAARTVFVISLDTWSRRTCRAKNIKQEDGADADEYETFSTFTEAGRKFSIVVVDEAYKVKHANTGNWKSVALLERQFTLLVTATPCMNTLSDLIGPARLLWTSPQEYLKKKAETWNKIEKEFLGLEDLERLDREKPWDDLQLIGGWPSMLTKLIQTGAHKASSKTDIEGTRKYLKYFERLAILRRAPSSSIYWDWERKKTVPLDGLLPNVDNFTVNIQSDHALEKAYQNVHMGLLIEYMDAVQNFWKNSDTTPIMVTYRRFQLASASLDVYRLDKLFSLNGFGAKVQDVAVMRKSTINFMHLASFLLKPGDPKPKVALDYVKLGLRESPVLRYIIHHIRQNNLDNGPTRKIQKLLITEASPMLAYYYELFLQFLLIHCKTLHSGLSHDERRELIASFNDDSDHSCQILIQMYTVGFAGSNLHKNCSQVLVASQAHSLPVQWQTVHRVIRVGQEADVKVFRVKVNNSFHSFRESRQIEKILPELGTRAQGSINNVLVQLLNLFQYEVNEAWKSPEGRRLVRSRNMMLDPYEAPEAGPAEKRIKLEDGSSAEAGPADQDAAEPAKVSFMSKTGTKRTIDGSNESAASDCADYFPDLEEFLALKTRSAYYEEYKRYPEPLKTSFSNAKNNLRRLLSYGGPFNNKFPKVWKVQDLDDPAVLERAMELMLRVRLGSKAVEMLPYPLIDFSLVDPEKKERLERLLGGVDITDQDIETVREEGSKPKDIDEHYDNTTKGGITHAIKRLEREAKDAKAISKFMSEVTTRSEEEDLEEVEGADIEHEDDDSDDGDGVEDDDDTGLDYGYSDPDDDQQDGEESQNIGFGASEASNQKTDTKEQEATVDHNGNYDDNDDDIIITSSRSTGRASAKSKGVVIKTEETDDVIFHGVNTTNTVDENLDHKPEVKSESPSGNIISSTNHVAGARSIASDGSDDALKEELPGESESDEDMPSKGFGFR
ncbi:SNF2 family N-terminal domain-containing protein [Hypoxylon sp. FL1150]|nr:SNF2 family N-terminal domain-containing protein [Hypoxylon sp. FL1150]